MRNFSFSRGKLTIAAIFFLGVILGVVSAWGIHALGHKQYFATEEGVRWFGDRYQFISPLLACGEHQFDHVSNKELAEFEKELLSLTTLLKTTKQVDDIGVYFRQLKGGPWLGVNEDVEFTPGSLLKVPLVMSVYKMAETNTTLLETEIFYEAGEADASKHFTNVAIQPGRTYSVEDLVSATLQRSDNNAAVLLAQIIGPEALSRSYTELGVEPPTSGGDYSTTVRTYASFFRVLYNATYTTHDFSESILKTLTETTFKDGIVAGVPEGIPVAHKFGERSLDSGHLIQLHDCGVVYHPSRPYLLCVMTRGDTYSKLADAIADISRVVYKHVD